MRSQRYGEALVRSGIVGKIREVHTFSNKSWGDDKPLPRRDRSGAGAARLGRVARRDGRGRSSAASTTQANGGGASGFGTGTLGDMGCHIYSPPYRALALTRPIAVTAHGPRPRPRAGRRRPG